MSKKAARERFSVPIGSNRLAYFGRWPHPEGKYRNFAIMHTEARERLVQFVADRERILSDERLSPTGKREEITKAVSAFHKVAANWQGNAVKDRKPQILEEITAMRGVSSRKEGDLVGQMADWEMRTWYKGLKGDELSQFNGGLARGEHAEIASALCRLPGEVTDLRPDLRDAIIDHSITPENAGRFNELAEELRAIELAEDAFETAAKEVRALEHSHEEISREAADRALDVMGVPKPADRVDAISKGEPDPGKRNDGTGDKVPDDDKSDDDDKQADAA